VSSDKRFYGIYQGIVIDNQDPTGRGRITVQVPQVTGQAVTDWVDVCSTDGGSVVGSPVYGAFSDYTTQTIAANTAQVMQLGQTDESTGVSIVDGSKITFKYAGTYNLQWSGQFETSDTQTDDVSVWLRKNGVDIVGSTGLISIPNKHGGVNGHTIAGWNFVFTTAANDYYEWVWSSNSASVSIATYAAATVPTRPSTASLIVTATPVGNIFPNIGAIVWIMYIAGDPNFPVWMGVLK
jgi:Type VI secretion system/phage-baseplate injector OB domain